MIIIIIIIIIIINITIIIVIILFVLFLPFCSQKVEAKDNKVVDAPEAKKDMSKEIQDKSKDVVQPAGDTVKKDKQEEEEDNVTL